MKKTYKKNYVVEHREIETSIANLVNEKLDLELRLKEIKIDISKIEKENKKE